MLEIRLLGQFEIRHAGQLVHLPLRPAQALLAYLLLNPGIPHRREKLAGLFWPDLPEASARGNLRHALWRIRKALGASDKNGRDYLLADELTVAFDLEAGVWLDTRVLEQPAALDALTAAVDVYRGELLPGFYDDWIGAERERLQAVFEAKMALLLDALAAAERWDEVLAWGERWIALAHTPEAAYRALIAAHAARGDSAAAAAVYQRCLKALHEQLGVEPSPATRAAYERALRGIGWREPPEPVRTSVPRHNLPAPVSRFVGREGELAYIDRLITDPFCRLVTLVGPGGAGKTRLAVEAARRLLPRFPDGAWLASLAPLDRAEAVPAAVSAALGLQAPPGMPLAELLAGALRDRQLLLVLDNCEHVLEGAALLATQLLAQCPALRVLATSREGLHAEGEHPLVLAGLSVPAAGGEGRAALIESEAGRLLVDRAEAARPGFAVDAHNAGDLTQICRDLDGLPLALELAAARLTSLSPQEVAERLSERFQFLGGRRGTPARHRSLEAAIDWSYQLLSDAERLLFSRLSTFRGGWTPEAAEQVCAGEGVQASAVPELLGSLVDKSLVLAETTAEGDTRYRLLETLREFGEQQLLESGQAGAVSERHAHYYLCLAEAAQAVMGTPDEPAVVARLAREEDNFFAAMRRSLDRDRGATALRIGSAISGYLADTARRWSEYVDILAPALDQHPQVAPLQRSRVLCQLAYFNYLSGQVDQAQAETEEALQLAEASGDRAWLGSALFAKGFCLSGEASRPYFAASAELARETDDLEAAMSLRFLAQSEPPARALALIREYQEMALRRGALYDLSSAACGLAELAYALGDLAEAEQQWRAACQYCEQLSNRWNRAEILQELARVAWSTGEHARAARLIAESLDLTQQSGWLPGLASALRGKGILAWWQGNYTEAAARFGESDASASRWNRPAVQAVTGVWRTKLARDTGDLAAAETHAERALKVLQEGSTVGRAGWCQGVLASVAHRQGDLARALALYQEALRSMPHDRNLLDLRDVLEGGALALAATGEHQTAARLLGFTAAKRATFGIVRPAPEQVFYDQELARLKAAMAADAFAQDFDAGRTLTFEQAVGEALGEARLQAG